MIKLMKYVVVSVFLVTAASAGFAADKTKAVKAPVPSICDGNYKLTLNARVGSDNLSASVMIQNGVQSSFGGIRDIPVEMIDETTKATEISHTSMSYDFSAAPSCDPKTGLVALRSQLDLSSVDLKKSPAKIQLTSQIMLEKGKTVVLFEEGDRKVEILLEDVK